MGKGDARTRAHTYTHIHMHTYTHTHIHTHTHTGAIRVPARLCVLTVFLLLISPPTPTMGVYGGGYGEVGGEAGKGKRGEAHDIYRFVSDSRADNGLGFRVLGFRV